VKRIFKKLEVFLIIRLLSPWIWGNFAITPVKAEEGYIFSCPNNLEALVERMLLDLPSYSNRVIQRTRSIIKDKQLTTQRYIIVAGKAEFQPLPSQNTEYTPITPDSSEQVFFTTLEREYRHNRVVETQNYHWLFLTKTENGWRRVMMYSRFGVGANIPAMPPQTTTNGVIGRAIGIWLEDCRAGVLKSLAEKS
jgi:hypothetical protein